jgi:hypothetical protein
MTNVMQQPVFYWVLCNMPGIKKIITVLLLSAYLLPATAVTELLKLPQLVEHFYDHKEEGSKTSFIAYLVQHYIKEDGTDKDAAEDSRLPFKTGEQLLSVMVISVDPPQSFSITPVALPVVKKMYTISNDDFISSQYLNAIWQPPRIC